MLKALDKLMLAGLGAWTMTRQRAEEIFEEYVRRGEAERPAQPKFVRELVDTAEKSRKEFGEFLSKHLQEALAKLNLPSREDLARVEAKIDKLMNRKGHAS